MKSLNKWVVATAPLFFALACGTAPGQNATLNPLSNRQQKAPTPGYRSKPFPLNPQSAHKIQKPNRFIPLASQNAGSPKGFGGKRAKVGASGKQEKPILPKGPGISPGGKPITAWAAGKRKNYPTLYQDAH